MGAPKGFKPTKKQIKALNAGRKAGHKAAKADRAAGKPTATERWKSLLSGDITVKNLSDKELQEMRVEGIGGRYHKGTIPSGLAMSMRNEYLRRCAGILEGGLKDAVAGMRAIANDPDVRPETRLRAQAMLADRGLGKVPDKVVMQIDSGWDALLDDVAPGTLRDLAPENAEE